MTIQGEPVAHNDLVAGGETTKHSHAGGGGGGCNLLASIVSTSSGSSVNNWQAVPGLSATVSIANASSVVQMAASVALILRSDDNAHFRFAVDGSKQGPNIPVFVDATNEGNGLSGLVWFKTGISGSHTFALHWQNTTNQSMSLDTGRESSLQIIEFLN